MFLFSLNAITPLLITLGLGMLINLRGHIGEGDKRFLNRLCFSYLLPVHLFNSTLSIDFSAEFDAPLLAFCAASILALAILAWIVFSLIIPDRQYRCIYIMTSFRSNFIIYALPLAVNMFGEEGAKKAAMLVPVSIILYNLLAVIDFIFHAAKKPENTSVMLRNTLIDILRNPLIIGSALGIASSLLHLPLPPSIRGGISSIASMATPVALVLLGSQVDIKELRGDIKNVLAACALRLVIVPLLIVPLALLFGFRGSSLGVLMVCFAAPCAVSGMVMARNYDTAPLFAAQVVYLSTILSIFTMFIIISLMRGLGLM